MSKCELPNGLIVRPDGVNELDPCIYDEIERHSGCIVHVMRCRRCGHIEISWERQKKQERRKNREQTRDQG